MLIKNVPSSRRSDVLSFYNEKTFSKNIDETKKYTLLWSYREASLSKNNSCKKDIRDHLNKYDFLTLAKPELHYLINNFFIQENFILKNIEKISKLPVFFIHGKNDGVCNQISSQHNQKG